MAKKLSRRLTWHRTTEKFEVGRRSKRLLNRRHYSHPHKKRNIRNLVSQ